MRPHLAYPFTGSALLVTLLSGCATLESESEPDWTNAQIHRDMPIGSTTSPLVRFLADTEANDDGSRIAITNRDDVYLIDGESGNFVAAVGADIELRDFVHAAVRVGDVTYRLDEATSHSLMLPESNRLIIFDYDDYASGAERVTALDLEAGEVAWHHTDYRYSLQQYSQLVEQATQRLADTVASFLGGEGHGETIYNRRERQRHFMRHTMAAVDDGEAILFKTFDGLVKLDAATGEELWQVEAFSGPGIHSVEQLDNGDYLVLSTGVDLGRLQASDAYHLARISSDGEVRWLSEHSGHRVGHLTVAEGRVAVDAWPLQVYDLETGDQLWDNDVLRNGVAGSNRRTLPQPKVLIEDGVLYQAATTHGADDITVGYPHEIAAYDLDSGQVLWTSEETDTYFGALYMLQGQLVTWGAGELFAEGNGGAAALDPQTGDIQWRTPAMDSPGTLSFGPWVAPPVFDDQQETLYIAGPGALYGVDIATGNTVLEADIGNADLGDVVGLIRHDDNLVFIGEDGVGTYAMTDGGEQYRVPTEHVDDFHHRGDRLVLEVGPGGIMAMAERRGQSPAAGNSLEPEERTDLARWNEREEPLGPDGFEEDPAGVVALDLNTGTLGPLAAWGGRPWLFGDLSVTRVIVDDTGNHAWIVDENGALSRFSL